MLYQVNIYISSDFLITCFSFNENQQAKQKKQAYTISSKISAANKTFFPHITKGYNFIYRCWM
jgi:hypothetical protein